MPKIASYDEDLAVLTIMLLIITLFLCLRIWLPLENICFKPCVLCVCVNCAPTCLLLCLLTETVSNYKTPQAWKKCPEITCFLLFFSLPGNLGTSQTGTYFRKLYSNSNSSHFLGLEIAWGCADYTWTEHIITECTLSPRPSQWVHIISQLPDNRDSRELGLLFGVMAFVKASWILVSASHHCSSAGYKLSK